MSKHLLCDIIRDMATAGVEAKTPKLALCQRDYIKKYLKILKTNFNIKEHDFYKNIKYVYVYDLNFLFSGFPGKCYKEKLYENIIKKSACVYIAKIYVTLLSLSEILNKYLFIYNLH